MPIVEIQNNALVPLEPTTFAAANITERGDLQRLLRRQIELICPDVLVIAEEFGQWEDSQRRIDLLGVDRFGALVVIELKRTETGGHMELQALRYAAMVSTMTFEQAVSHYTRFLEAIGDDVDAEVKLRSWLELENETESVEAFFGQSVRIVLASAAFGKELTTAVLWLNEQGLDIVCVRMNPYQDGPRVMLDIQQIIPLPEAEQFQVKLREKAQRERATKKRSRDLTKFDVTVDNETETNLTKRQAVYNVVSALIEKGITPEQIMEAAGFRKTNSFVSVKGEVRDQSRFNQLVKEKRDQEERRYDAYRFYTEDDTLLYINGTTYAVSNQWGGRAEEWVSKVLAVYSNHGIEIRPASSTPIES